jgi:lipopolysaccharide/colanic/teichoic acid biosynthesis glycosyltransferase
MERDQVNFPGIPADPMPWWKRAIDVLGSGLGLLVLTPGLLAAAVAIKLASPGPALLKQKRVGRQGAVFVIWKFRTMQPEVDDRRHQEHLKQLIEMDIPMIKLDASDDPRVFPLGRMLRRFYIDELPQLINVFRGEMSLVGPRPCLPYEAAQLKPFQRARFRTLPGMTGLWQVSGKTRTTFSQMIQLDIAYADRLSLLLDLKIIFKTLPAIVAENMQRRGVKKSVQVRRSA